MNKSKFIEIYESTKSKETWTLKCLKQMLDKYDYGYEPDEISHALHNPKLETMSLENIVKYFNKNNLSKEEVDRKLKNALN